MITLPVPVTNHIAAGGMLNTHVLIWVTARDRSTSDPESLGLWTGSDTQTITVGGADRDYQGAGTLLDIDPLKSSAGMRVDQWSFRVSSLSENVVAAVRQYEARLAPVEVHQWFWNATTNRPLADPVRAFRGTIMTVDLPTPALGDSATATITCVSDAWRLTRGLTLKRSDTALQARAPGDTFRQYNALTGVQVAWGEKTIITGGGSSGGGGGDGFGPAR